MNTKSFRTVSIIMIIFGAFGVLGGISMLSSTSWALVSAIISLVNSILLLAAGFIGTKAVNTGDDAKGSPVQKAQLCAHCDRRREHCGRPDWKRGDRHSRRQRQHDHGHDRYRRRRFPDSARIVLPRREKARGVSRFCHCRGKSCRTDIGKPPGIGL